MQTPQFITKINMIFSYIPYTNRVFGHHTLCLLGIKLDVCYIVHLFHDQYVNVPVNASLQNHKLKNLENGGMYRPVLENPIFSLALESDPRKILAEIT